MEVELLLNRICRECTPKPISALKLFQGDEECSSSIAPAQHGRDYYSSFDTRVRCIPTGLAPLDRMLKGGIRIGSISELVGPSGVGKTQLALQLCIMAARYNHGAIYLDTEKKMTLTRLREMSNLRQRHQDEGVNADGTINCRDRERDFSYSHQYHGGHSAPENRNSHGMLDVQSPLNEGSHKQVVGFKSSESVLSNLTVYHPGSTDELLESLDSLEEEILHRNQLASQADSTRRTPNGAVVTFPVRLVIVDSIAAPIRRDFGSDSAPQRAAAIFHCAQVLKRLADQLHLAVVVINQIGAVDRAMEHYTAVGGADTSDPLAVRAALGVAWHHCVTTRLSLELVATPSPVGAMQLYEGGDVARSGATRVPVSDRTTRRVCIVKSNLVAFAETTFEISSLGIVEGGRHLESVH